MRDISKLDIAGMILVICLSAFAGYSHSAEKCADGTECPTDQELEDSCSDEGESL